MYKNSTSYFARAIFWVIFFQGICVTAYPQGEFKWSKPFNACWSYKSNQIIGDKVASDNAKGITVFAKLSGILTALNNKSGEVFWNTSIGGKLVSKPFFSGDSLYLLIETTAPDTSPISTETTSENISLIFRSVNILTGLTKQEKIFHPANQLLSFQDERKVVLFYDDAGFIIVDSKYGDVSAEIKNNDRNLRVSTVNLLKDILFVGTHDKEILLFSAVDGKLLKKISTNSIPENIFWDGRESLIWTDSRGFINALNIETNKIAWKKRSGAALSTVIRTHIGLLVSSLDNFVYMLDEKNGDVIWKKRFSDKLLDISLIGKNAVVILPFDSGVASVLDINNGRLINSLKLSDSEVFQSVSPLSDSDLVFSTADGIIFFSSTICQEK